MEIWPGRDQPLGAHVDAGGTNFALFSDGATAVTLCLFDADGTESKLAMTELDGYVWHGYVPGVGEGQRHGFRVDGPWEPANGLRFNAAKLLLDPYTKGVEGSIDWGQQVFGYHLGEPLVRNDEVSAPHTYRSVVVDDSFDWNHPDGSGDQRPDTPYHESVIYETHVKGLAALHPDAPEDQRGRYAGVAHPSVVTHLKKVGATAVELMPVHQFVQDERLQEQGLRNYWGYDTIGFFAPHNEYATSADPCDHVREFKEMVKELHRNGL